MKSQFPSLTEAPELEYMFPAHWCFLPMGDNKNVGHPEWYMSNSLTAQKHFQIFKLANCLIQ
ncbi:hypothetical protein A8C56_05895 [Niabella ginsenosidivorans]|uniref:Uncharacterized protein n=1 Tax=Niabella ginsenosidivorans TaxID=1176587 RepID=A0A1A9I1L3_9BACT|nr:hypothetical protein A8C56_05895 [Niabella ginsenosidivorans]